LSESARLLCRKAHSAAAPQRKAPSPQRGLQLHGADSSNYR